MPEQVVRKRTYLIVWAVLMALIGLNGGLSFIDLGKWNTPIAFSIAVAMATLVVTFDMHMRYEKQKAVLIWATGAAAFLTILFILTLNDYTTRGFLRVPGK